jgi:hypothetical protein
MLEITFCFHVRLYALSWTALHMIVLYYGKSWFVRYMKQGYLKCSSKQRKNERYFFKIGKRYEGIRTYGPLTSRDTQKSQTIWPDIELTFHFKSNRSKQSKCQWKIQMAFSLVTEEPHAAVGWEKAFQENIVVKNVVMILDNLVLLCAMSEISTELQGK